MPEILGSVHVGAEEEEVKEQEIRFDSHGEMSKA
jgi:hypothetical protein